jgi:hypothetical protein
VTPPNDVEINEAIIIGDDRLVGVIIKIRDKIADLNKEYEEALKTLREQKQRIENEVIRRLQERGASQTKTGKGTAFLGESMQATIADETQFKRFCLEQADLDFFQSRVKVAHLKEFMDNNEGKLPPGISVFREVTLNVRIPTKRGTDDKAVDDSGAG